MSPHTKAMFQTFILPIILATAIILIPILLLEAMD